MAMEFKNIVFLQRRNYFYRIASSDGIKMFESKNESSLALQQLPHH